MHNEESNSHYIWNILVGYSFTFTIWEIKYVV